MPISGGGGLLSGGLVAFDGNLIDDISTSGHFGCLSFNIPALFFCVDRPFECDLTVLGNDLDIVPVSRKRFVSNDRFPDLLHGVAVGSSFFRLIGGSF